MGGSAVLRATGARRSARRPNQRRHVRIGVLTAALLAGGTGCGDPDLLDPTEDPLAADRERVISSMTEGMAAAADQLGAGEVLGTRVDTWCSAGEDTWKDTDDHRSTCQMSLSTGFPLSTGVDVALGGSLEGMLAFEERMDAAGWGSADWFLSINQPGVGVEVDHLREYGLPVTQVTGVRLYSAQGNDDSITLSFQPAATPVDPARPSSPAGYYRDTEGADWQTAWSAESAWHPYVLVGYGDAVLAEQPW
ncbi:hypothetical protein [Geodermatophilus sp. SYSU D00867]